MNTRIYGSTVLSVWTALRLRSKGSPVELYLLKKESQALRPIRVPRNLLSEMVAHLSRLGIPVAHILEAPVVKGWVSPAGEIFERVWPESGGHEERWIDPVKLNESLIRACELEGVSIRNVEVFPLPQWDDFDYLGIFEAESVDIAHWSKAFQTYSEESVYDVTEVLFPRGMETSLQKIVFFEFEGIKGVLENLNRQKSVLTLISRSRILIDRLIDDLRTRLSEKETGNLRALFALNPHVFRRDSKSRVGESGLYIPQFCLIGAGVGTYPSLMNTHVREGLKQIKRLEEHLEKYKQSAATLDYLRVAEDWYRQERRSFLKLLSWQRGWETWLWSRMRQSWALRVNQFLPSRLKDFLNSPL